jgi:hypothetical protein
MRRKIVKGEENSTREVRRGLGATEVGQNDVTN